MDVSPLQMERANVTLSRGLVLTNPAVLLGLDDSSVAGGLLNRFAHVRIDGFSIEPHATLRSEGQLRPRVSVLVPGGEIGVDQIRLVRKAVENALPTIPLDVKDALFGSPATRTAPEVNANAATATPSRSGGVPLQEMLGALGAMTDKATFRLDGKARFSEVGSERLGILMRSGALHPTVHVEGAFTLHDTASMNVEGRADVKSELGSGQFQFHSDAQLNDEGIAGKLQAMGRLVGATLPARGTKTGEQAEPLALRIHAEPDSMQAQDSRDQDVNLLLPGRLFTVANEMVQQIGRTRLGDEVRIEGTPTAEVEIAAGFSGSQTHAGVQDVSFQARVEVESARLDSDTIGVKAHAPVVLDVKARTEHAALQADGGVAIDGAHGSVLASVRNTDARRGILGAHLTREEGVLVQAQGWLEKDSEGVPQARGQVHAEASARARVGKVTLPFGVKVTRRADLTLRQGEAIVDKSKTSIRPKVGSS